MIPTTKLTAAPAIPTRSEIRAPSNTRKNKSRPLRSVPKACSGEGGRKLWAVTSPLAADSRTGPTRAAMATPTTINVEAIIAGFRRSLLQAERESVIQNDSAIEDTIENVRHQVEQNEQDAVDDHDSSQEKPVAIQHRVDEKSAGARNAEDAFHHDGAGQKVGGKRAEK